MTTNDQPGARGGPVWIERGKLRSELTRSDESRRWTGRKELMQSEYERDACRTRQTEQCVPRVALAQEAKEHPSK
jgi:hypothetical protein